MKKQFLNLFVSLIVFLLMGVTGRAALLIEFDYTYDTTDFFSGVNSGRRAILEAAADVFEARLTSETFGAIVPGGINTWSLMFPNPSTGEGITIVNPVVPENTITIYVGARNLSGPLGMADYGYSVSGELSWFNMIQARNSSTNFDSFGGAITFESGASWYFV